MLVPRRGPHHDVVKVHQADEPLKTGEGGVHHALEHAGGVLEAKWHTGELVEAAVRDEGGLGDRVLGHGNLPEALGAVEGGHVLEALQHHQRIVDARQRVEVGLRNAVEGAVVHYLAVLPAWLRHEEEAGSPRGLRFADDTHAEHHVKLGVDFGATGGRHLERLLGQRGVVARVEVALHARDAADDLGEVEDVGVLGAKDPRLALHRADDGVLLEGEGLVGDVKNVDWYACR